MLIHIIDVEVTGPHTLRLTFDDAASTEKEVNLLAELEGPVYEPLKDAEFFERVILDTELGTIVWPNGADFAPDFLFGLPESVAA